mgnify:CR=1 FL=1
MIVIIISNGPGLPEVVNEYGHSSSWIPALVKDKDITLESRGDLIIKLQSDTSFIEGDSSYKFAYYHRMYDMIKVRLIEGASNNYIESQLGKGTSVRMVMWK